MANLDLSKFKKMSCDKNCTVLKHADGHELRIAHGGLTGKLKSDIDKIPMAEGGGVDREVFQEGVHQTAKKQGQSGAGALHELGKKYPEMSHLSKASHSRNLETLKSMPKPNLEGLAEGGRVEPSAAGINRPVDKEEPGMSRMGHHVREGNGAAAKDTAHKTLREMDRQPKPKLFADGGDTEDDSNSPQASIPAININLNGAPQQPSGSGVPPYLQPNAPEPKKPSGASVDWSAKGQDDGQAQPAQQPPQANAQAPQAMAQAPQAPIAQPPVPPVKQYLSEQDQAWQQDLANGHITPQTYQDLFAKKDTLGKIGTIFGLLVSGAGAGLTHQPNALLAMMDKQISNDLEAQKQSKTNAQNFLRLNQQHQLNDAQIKSLGANTQATAFATAQAQMLQSSYHDLVQKVNRMPEGPQKEQAKQMLGVVYSKIGEKVNNINDQTAGAGAYQQMLFGQPSAGSPTEKDFQKQTTGMRMLGPQGEARAKDLETKHFPGFQGQASRPLTGEDNSFLQSGTNFQGQLDDFIDWSKKHSGDLSPSDMKEGAAKAADLQGAYRQATHGGVYKEGEQNFISKLIDDDPTKFFNEIRVLPSLNAISSDNKRRVSQYAKNLGLSGGDSGTDHPLEGKTITNKSTGERKIMKNGKWEAVK